MYRITCNPDAVNITEFRWPWALLCLVFVATTCAGAWQSFAASDLGLVKGVILGVAVAGMVVGAVIFSTHTTYKIDASREALTWCRWQLGRKTGGVVLFDQITGVGLQALSSTRPTSTRVVVYNAGGAVPLSIVYSGNYARNKKLAADIRELIERKNALAGGDLLQQSLRAMVARGQTLQATVLLKKERGLSTREARTHISELARELSAGDSG